MFVPPFITRLLNLAQQEGEPDSVALRDAAQAARDDLRSRVARAREIVPHLEGGSGSPAVAAFEDAALALEESLGQLAAVCSENEVGLIPAVLDRVEARGKGYASRLAALRALRPWVCADPAFTDACLLARAALTGAVDGPDRLRAMLPTLYRCLREVEGSVADPPAVEDVRMGLGGLLLYCEEGRSADLSNALSLLLRGLGRVFPAREQAGDAPLLQGSRHLHDLDVAIAGAYRGVVPDASLRQRLEVMSRTLAAFRARTLRFRSGHPDEAETADAIARALDDCEVAFGHVWTYLETGTRASLLEARPVLATAGAVLISLSSEEGEVDSPRTCPSCGVPATVGTSTCAACGSDLPLRPAFAIDVMVGEDDASDVAENFAFTAAVVADVVGGALSPDAARTLLQPLWDTVHDVEHCLGRLPDARDAAVETSRGEFAALVASLRDVLRQILVALHEQDLHSLPPLRARLLDLARALGQSHHEHVRGAGDG